MSGRAGAGLGLALLLLGGLPPAFAQAGGTGAPPASPPGNASVAAERAEEHAARRAYSASLMEARKARDVQVKEAEAQAVQRALAAGKDPVVAQREAYREARQATQAEFDAKVRAAAQVRDAAIAAARAQAPGARP
jgi:hypothetical protein